MKKVAYKNAYPQAFRPLFEIIEDHVILIVTKIASHRQNEFLFLNVSAKFQS